MIVLLIKISFQKQITNKQQIILNWILKQQTSSSMRFVVIDVDVKHYLIH